MKFSSLYAALVVTFAFLMGCASTQRNKVAPEVLTFTNLNVDTTYHLFNDTSLQACQIHVNLVVVDEASDSLLKSQLNSYFLEETLGTQYSDKLVSEAIEQYTLDLIKDYKLFEEDIVVKNHDKQSPGYQMQNEVNMKIVFENKHFLSTNTEFYQYSGGAHGIAATHLNTFDLINRKSLRLDALFALEDLPKVGKVLVEQLAQDQKVTHVEDLHEVGFFSIDEILPTDNFIVKDDGITWGYVPYEIAPYVLGETFIKLTWEQLKPLLKEDAPVKSIFI